MNEIDEELDKTVNLTKESAGARFDHEKTAEVDNAAAEQPESGTGPVDAQAAPGAVETDGSEGQDGQEEAKEPEEPKKPFSDVLDWVSSMVYAVAIMLVLNLFFFRTITVRGDSMNDTLVDNDQVVVTNFFYTPSYGDIVVVQADRLNIQGTEIYGESIIKRVIAVAGDTIKIDYTKGEVYRNGELLNEDYIKELTHLYRYGYIENNVEYVVPENRVFVMGDNRNVSNDSRNLQDVGFIDEGMIIGKAIVRYSPIKDFKWL